MYFKARYPQNRNPSKKPKRTFGEKGNGGREREREEEEREIGRKGGRGGSQMGVGWPQTGIEA
jgi:hypothetical protein